MSSAAILLFDAQDDSRARIAAELNKRYGSDYDLIICSSSEQAFAQLDELTRSGTPVAVILAAYWLPGGTGVEYLQKARQMHPDAGRGLLFDWGDRTVTDGLQRGLALGIVDAYRPKPLVPGDEHFHKMITDCLHSWAMQRNEGFVVAQIVGDQWAPRSHELRDLLERNGILYAFHDMSSEQGQALMEKSQLKPQQLPAIVMASGEVLDNPSNTALAQALNVSSTYQPGDAGDQVVDVVIVGAGPAGLSAAVYSASEGLRTVVIESTALGGQAGMSSRIRNYLGFPLGISGNELAGNAYQQAWMFGASFIFVQKAEDLKVEGNERIVTLTDGSPIRSRAVILAPGITYRRLEVPALDRLIGAGVYYGAAGTEALAMRGQQVFVVGGGNSAGQAAVHLARFAQKVIVVVRGRALSTTMSDYLIKEIENSDNIEVRVNTQIVDGSGDYRLERVVLEDSTSGKCETMEAAGVFVLIGATPTTDWLPPEIERIGQGYIVTGQDLVRDGQLPPQWPLKRAPLLLETSIPRVFACGDVRHRSVKRVASAVGEGAISVQLIHQVLNE